MWSSNEQRQVDNIILEPAPGKLKEPSSSVGDVEKERLDDDVILKMR